MDQLTDKEKEIFLILNGWTVDDTVFRAKYFPPWWDGKFWKNNIYQGLILDDAYRSTINAN